MNNKLVEDYLNEIDPVSTAILIANGVALTNLLAIFTSFYMIRAASKRLPKFEKKLKSIIGGKFEVRVVKDKLPNAFVFYGNTIFITSRLLQLLTEREVISVLLHEAYHAKNYHIWKRMAVQYPFFYIVAFIASQTYISYPIFTIFVSIIILMSGDISKNILIARKQESMSDGYATKNGYGKEIASSLLKLEKEFNKGKNKECGKLCEAVKKLNDICAEHPPIKQRVEDVMKEKETWTTVASGSPAKLKSYF